SGIVLGAAYMLSLYQRTMFGKIENPKNEKLLDLSGREFATFAPLLILAVWMGLYPKPFLDRLSPAVDHVIARVSPEYGKIAAANCDPVVTPAVVATNAAAQFLAAAPCGPDGKPLDAAVGSLTAPGTPAPAVAPAAAPAAAAPEVRR